MIVWYGERGVVNAAVAHLAAHDAGPQFLKCIQWAAGSAPAWVEKVTGVTFVVEVGLADFGNPDLVIVCRCADDPLPRCVFVEAKVVPYAASAIANATGMGVRGFNSACNGQLALKYRFAKALEAWDGRRERIVEPDAVHEAYRLPPAEGGLGDPLIRPRRLQKRQILAAILRPLGLAGLSLDHFSFVAMTWDRAPFFAGPPGQLPRFLDDRGTDCFGALSAQVGWLGYQHLEGVEGLLDVVSPALRLMVGSVEPTESDLTTATWPRLTSRPVSEMGQGLQQRVHSLEQIGVGTFGREAVQFHTGSISIRSAGRVEAKIVPQERGGDAFVLLGVRPEWPLLDWSGLDPHGYKVLDQPFLFVRLPDDPADTSRIAESVLTNLHDVVSDPRRTEESDPSSDV